MTPFEAQFGRPPPQIPKYEEGTGTIHEVDICLTNRDAVL